MTHNRKEAKMLRKLWNRLTNNPNKGLLIDGREWNPCNYDCYDDGGCSHCSDWFEWNDEEYGECGEWRHKSVSDKVRDFGKCDHGYYYDCPIGCEDSPEKQANDQLSLDNLMEGR